MGREPHALEHRRGIRDAVYVCDGVALGFMLGYPTASFILGSPSWSLLLTSVVGCTAVIAVATGLGRWLEAQDRPDDEASGCAAVGDPALRLQQS